MQISHDGDGISQNCGYQRKECTCLYNGLYNGLSGQVLSRG
jgi:hypothetical protein